MTADTTYEAIDLEDCQPHLKAQDEEPHIYEEISKGGLDGGKLSAQEGNPSVSAEIETIVSCDSKDHCTCNGLKCNSDLELQ